MCVSGFRSEKIRNGISAFIYLYYFKFILGFEPYLTQFFNIHVVDYILLILHNSVGSGNLKHGLREC